MDEQRVGAAERELAMGALDEHRRADRLDTAEYHRRSAAAAGATARAELDALFVDLPAPHPDYGGTAPTDPDDRDVAHRAVDPPPGRQGSGNEGARPDDDRAIDLPELVTPVAATIARHAGLLSLLAPVIAFGVFALTGFRFPFVFLLVPVAIGVLTYLAHRHAG